MALPGDTASKNFDSTGSIVALNTTFLSRMGVVRIALFGEMKSKPAKISEELQIPFQMAENETKAMC